MAYDFNIMYDSGTALWQGQYTGIYPLPINGLFALLSLMPRLTAFALMMFVSLALFVAILRRRALLWLFFHPVLAVLRLGQVDLLFLWLLYWNSGVALALMTLKPQLFPLAIPSLLADRAKWRPFALACLGLYGPATLVRPSWPVEWLRHINDGRLSIDSYSTTIFSNMLAGFVILLVASLFLRLDWRAIFWSCNPTIRWYDFSMMAGGSLWLIPLSWLLWWIARSGFIYNNPSPVALLGLVDLAFRQRKGMQPLRMAERAR